MSTTIKIAIGIILTLVISLGVESYIIHLQTSKIAKYNEQMRSLNDKIEQANESVKIQSVVSEVTDKVVTNATQRIMTNTQKGTAIKAIVDNVTKKVANENLSNTFANAMYANSMWDAYCTADPSDGACSSRQSVDRLPN